MSSGALFGNNSVRGINKNLVEFKAGKMTMKGKMVYPDSRKGLLYVYQSDDSLMHFCWKDRSTGVVEDDLIIFPDDCEFKLVTQCKTGRAYQLKFKSSSRKFFFWLQDFKTEKDEENCRKINEVLNNPPTPGSQRGSGANPEGDLQNLLNNMSQQQLMQLFGGVGQIGGLGSLLGSMNRPFAGNRNSSNSSNPTVTATKQSSNSSFTTSESVTASEVKKPAGLSGNSKGSQPSNNTSEVESATPAVGEKILLSDLQNFLSGVPTPSCGQRAVLNELSNAIPAAISSMENIGTEIDEYLPPGENLSTILSSPQFSQALSMFWCALQSGQAAPIVQQFGVSAEVVEAATVGNLEQFVCALENDTNIVVGAIIDNIKEENSIDEVESQKKSPAKQGFGNDFHENDDNDDEGMALD